MSSLLAPAVVLLLAQAPAQPPEKVSVSLDVQGSDQARAHLSRSLTELLSRLGVSVSEPGSGPAPFVQATVQVEATGCKVSLSDRQGQLVLFRRVPQQGSPEIAWEATAHVIHSALEELLLAERTPRVPLVSSGTVVQLDGPPALVPVVKRTVKEGLALSLSGFAGGRLFGGGVSESPVVAAGLGTELSFSLASRWQPGLKLELSYGSPFEVETTLVRLRTQTIAVRLLPTARLFGGERWGVHAALGGGADLFATNLGSLDVPAALLGRPRLDAAPVLTTALSGRLSVGRSSTVFLSLALDLDLAPRRFVGDVAGVRTELYQPWRFRPALVLGFTFSALGPDPWPEAEAQP